jgi:hypothetical protein
MVPQDNRLLQQRKRLGSARGLLELRAERTVERKLRGALVSTHSACDRPAANQTQQHVGLNIGIQLLTPKTPRLCGSGMRKQ